MPMNILYVIWSLKTGGAERCVVNLAKGLDKTKYNPIVCCLNAKGELAQELEKEGILVIALNKRGKFDFSVVRKLVEIMQVNHIQVAHTHLWGANFWGRLAAKKAGVPVVIAHEHGIEQWRGRFHSYLDKVLYKNTDRVVFVSEASRNLFLSMVKVGPEKCRVVYNGVDVARSQVTGHRSQVRKSLGLKDDDFIITSIGRLVKEKGHEYSLGALKLVLEKRPNTKALIVGDGQRMEELRSLKEKLGLNGSVNFLGKRDDIQDILSATDIFVLASTKEAMPLSILEAMASAKTVIATDVGGNRELVVNEKTGLLVPAKNSRALAEAILRVMDNLELAEQMAANGQKQVRESFSTDRWIKNIESLYREVLEKK